MEKQKGECGQDFDANYDIDNQEVKQKIKLIKNYIITLEKERMTNTENLNLKLKNSREA